MPRPRVPSPKEVISVRRQHSSGPRLMPGDEVWLRAKVRNVRDPDGARGVTLDVEGYPGAVSVAASEIVKRDQG